VFLNTNVLFIYFFFSSLRLSLRLFPSFGFPDIRIRSAVPVAAAAISGVVRIRVPSVRPHARIFTVRFVYARRIRFRRPWKTFERLQSRDYDVRVFSRRLVSKFVCQTEYYPFEISFLARA